MMQNLINQFKKPIISLKINKRGTEAYIISYPKCGRTWLRVMIGKAICEQYQLPAPLMLDTFHLTKRAGLKKSHFSHDYSSILSGFSYQFLPRSKSRYASNHVIFIIREIKDVLVSSYFQATKRAGQFEGSLSDFIRSDRFGVKKIVTFYNSWYEQQHIPRTFLLLTYEAMFNNPGETLTQALDFIGMKDVGEGIVKTAVSFATFKNMQIMEKNGVFNDRKLRPTQKNDQESYKVRRGKVGGHIDYLSLDDIAYIDTIIAEMGCPFAQIYYPTNSSH
jgi:hypothetical protein